MFCVVIKGTGGVIYVEHRRDSDAQAVAQLLEHGNLLGDKRDILLFGQGWLQTVTRHSVCCLIDFAHNDAE
jgi:hypothetical protein